MFSDVSSASVTVCVPALANVVLTPPGVILVMFPQSRFAVYTLPAESTLMSRGLPQVGPSIELDPFAAIFETLFVRPELTV